MYAIAYKGDFEDDFWVFYFFEKIFNSSNLTKKKAGVFKFSPAFSFSHEDKKLQTKYKK